MENRALLAFALSMAVFFLYMQFFGPKPPPAKPAPAAGAPASVTAATAPAPVTAAPAVIAQAPAAPLPAAAAATAATAAAAAFGNALVSATVSTGRSLENWVLHRYRAAPEKGAPPVDLAAAGESHLPLALSLHADGSSPAFAVSGRSPTAVTFVSAGAGGLTESRTWRIGDGYVAELEWTAVNRGSASQVVHPAVVLAETLDYEKMSSYDLHGPIVSQGENIERPDKKEAAAAPSFTGVRYTGFDNKYFLKAVLIPPELRESTVALGLKQAGDLSTVSVRVTLPQAVVEPGAAHTVKLRFFYGPKVASVLTSAGAGLETSIDYGFFGFLARPLLSLLKLFHTWVKNYGIAIILVTILIKLLFYPLTRKSFTAMRDMQRVQPKLEEIKKKHAKDKERLNKEMMELYRTEGINPLGGCLPMLLQIPVFFALYQVLLNAIELRHAPFMLWVTDLSAPEHLFSMHLLGYELPFRLLPLVMGVTMMLQQKMTPSTMDKAQQQIMMIMPVMFTFLFWGFPAGLVLYWLVNNVISIGQQWWITRGAAKPA